MGAGSSCLCGGGVSSSGVLGRSNERTGYGVHLPRPILPLGRRYAVVRRSLVGLAGMRPMTFEDHARSSEVLPFGGAEMRRDVSTR